MARKKKVTYNLECAVCGDPGRIRGIEKRTWKNVCLCDNCWEEDYEQHEGETVKIKRE